MHDFSCTDPADIRYSTLAERVRYFKENEKGVDAMCKAMEDMRNEVKMEERKLLKLMTSDCHKFNKLCLAKNT